MTASVAENVLSTGFQCPLPKGHTTLASSWEGRNVKERNKLKRPKYEYLRAGLDVYLHPFFHATAEPCPQSHTASTAQAHRVQFISVKPTALYQGATEEDLVTQHIFHLSKVCIEHGLILCVSHNHNTRAI